MIKRLRFNRVSLKLSVCRYITCQLALLLILMSMMLSCDQVLDEIVLEQTTQTVRFEEIFPLDGVANYPPEDMVANCGRAFPNAQATLRLHQKEGKTRIEIQVKNSVPNTYHTLWLKLDKPSPLTGGGGTALANPSAIAALAAATPDQNLTEKAKDLGLNGDSGEGMVLSANGFFTDDNGNGTFMIDLTFPFVNGAYPFQDFDSSLDAIPISTEPFTLRVASHCIDQVGHGLIAGLHERWFDWPK